MTQIVKLEGEANFLVLGEVVGVHMRDDCVEDGMFNILKYQPLTRLGYRDYSRITELFSLARPGE
jgi:flavin reductase (DIM6/NTAB) family NADH-FMN oxidoreductase RutF